MFVFESQNEQQTDLLGESLAAVLQSGCVIALNGPLGAGKTRLVRALCRALGIDDTQVNSPTFVLMQFYMDGRLPVVHMDTYRIADADEFAAIGADEYLFDSSFVCLVEWAERIELLLPADHLRLTIIPVSADGRRIEFSASGPKSQSLLLALQSQFEKS